MKQLFARTSRRRGTRLPWKLGLVAIPVAAVFGVIAFYGVWAQTFDMKRVGEMPERNTVFDVDGKIYSRLAGANRRRSDEPLWGLGCECFAF